MPEIHVTDRDGNKHTLDAPNGDPLMETLRDQDMDVEGICGGQCACGTCHVYVSEEWAAKLPAREEDEEDMLEAIEDMVEVKKTSRLSCQIEMSDELAGLTVEVAPEF